MKIPRCFYICGHLHGKPYTCRIVLNMREFGFPHENSSETLFSIIWSVESARNLTDKGIRRRETGGKTTQCTCRNLRNSLKFHELRWSAVELISVQLTILQRSSWHSREFLRFMRSGVYPPRKTQEPKLNTTWASEGDVRLWLNSVSQPISWKKAADLRLKRDHSAFIEHWESFQAIRSVKIMVRLWPRKSKCHKTKVEVKRNNYSICLFYTCSLA